MIRDLRTEVLEKIAFEKSPSKALEYYLIFMDILKGITIIKSGSDAGTIDLYEPFKSVPNIKDNLYTPFKNGKVNFFSERTIRSAKKDGTTITANQRRVSFDTQTISYLNRYYKGQEKEIPGNIENVMKLMRMHDIGVDYIPYAMENLLLSDEKVKEVADTLLSFEQIFHCHKVVFGAKLRVQSVITNYEKLRKRGNHASVYYMMYVVLMKMCYIQLKHSKYSLGRKMDSLFHFMDDQLHMLLIPELILAHRYFQKGQSYKFFGKIQKNREDLILCLRNMAWDLFHLRMLEIGCGVVGNIMIDLVVPYFYTYDKRLLEIKDCYTLEALAVCTRTHTTISFYSNEKEIKAFLQKQKASSKSHAKGALGDVNWDELVCEGEKEILALIS